MPSAPKRSNPDQGLFLKHFTAGKEHYDGGRLEEAERQLEEAYLLRPRDHKVLNLLGLTYFKQEKFDKAEEVYRKLAAESPEAHTLFYNLGLIYFKLGRLEDAEVAFLKALELSKDNPKINFYLGSIYERQRRFQDAIYQYRQAGANIMVRRMEDRLAPPAQRRASARGDETAEFAGREVREAVARARPRAETEPFLLPAKTIGPVSDVLLADGASRPGAAEKPRPRTSKEDTRPPETLPPTSPLLAAPPRPPAPRPAAGAGSSDIVAFLATLPAAGTERTSTTAVSGISGAVSLDAAGRRPTLAPTQLPPRAPETFRLLQKNLVEASFAGKLFVKQGTIYSYSGNLTFWVKDKRPGGRAALVIVTGTGKVLLTDRDREVSLASVDKEPLYVHPSYLLACEESLTPKPVRVGEKDDAPEFLALEGHGVAALSVGQRPLTLAVTPDLPVSVAAGSVIMWSGRLTSRLLMDDDLSAALATGEGAAPVLLRLEGSGRVLVEQLA